VSGQRDLPAGEFSPWLHGTRIAQREGGGADVPCGDCVACCTSSYFIHIRPEETQTLARIPGELLFPAVGLPQGNVVLGYDEKGRCPMLVEGTCSIYEHRPQTCRAYDCRVFAAAGITADRSAIAQRARRWKFDHPATVDRARHAAVRAAARFVRERADCFPGGEVPDSPAQVAILAIKVYEVFLDDGDESGKSGRRPPGLEVARAVTEANETFEAEREERSRSRRA
jgi:uncharacterized protein